MPHGTPSRVWQIVGTALFVINRETYLFVSDYYSKLPFVYVIQSPVTSTAVIAKIKSLFAEQGVPQRVISDNGGHFSSDAFRRFTDQWCFDHVTSSPHYPQSNGFIERHVQTMKHTLKKVGPRSDVHMALLVLRATPIDSHLPSPAELLYGRRVVANLLVATWNMPVARDVKFALASTSYRQLPKNAIGLYRENAIAVRVIDRSAYDATSRVHAHRQRKNLSYLRNGCCIYYLRPSGAAHL